MPRGKATDPLIVGPGRLTLVLELGRKAHVHVPTRDEDSIAWGDSRSTPGSMSGLERNPHVPAPTPDKVLGSGIYGMKSRMIITIRIIIISAGHER